MFGKPPRGFKHSEYNGIKFRSSWEVMRAKFLDDNNIVWKYEEITYDLGDSTYTPDFFIYVDNKLVQIEDVKSPWSLRVRVEKINKWKKMFVEESKIFQIIMKEDLHNEIFT